jgi:hypothetical protein
LAPADAGAAIRIEKRQARLEQERQSLARWMVRLRRAFHAMERQQAKIVRLERELAKLRTA